MKKLLTALFFAAFPILAFAADSSLSFAPPPSDYSVVFLGNIFGAVDGVLHGSGSQIVGAMFGVFNSAVLAIGGIIILYTLIVSTLNTAHEGQVLGQRWSSIWIPIRSTLGLALLIPKASGYCLMQIFIMWIVLQGVGAADKIWSTVLDYLNRGGVIIQAEVKNPLEGLSDKSSAAVPQGAAAILAGQVCMYGLQKQLEQQRREYQQARQNNAGPCADTAAGVLKPFCDTAVPDFTSTVNIVAIQNNNPNNQGLYTALMPNLDASSPYSFLNGICGQIQWSSYNRGDLSKINTSFTPSAGEVETIKLSRAIAIQQMYVDLASVARIMVNNDPAISQTPEEALNTDNYSPVAVEQYGVPYLPDGNSICRTNTDNCVLWGPAPGSTAAPLFSGTEFVGAITDYNGIMRPTLNLLRQADDKENSQKSRAFIQEAENKGWLLAGSYFFDLVRLNGSAAAPKDLVDKQSGLNNSVFPSSLTAPFAEGGSCVGGFRLLCTWFNGNPKKMSDLENLITGADLSASAVTLPSFNSSGLTRITSVVTNQSSTAYGYIRNALMVRTPGQPGIDPQFRFADLINVNVDATLYTLPSQRFDCGRVKILFFKFCLGRLFGDLFYNNMFRYIYNFFMSLFQQLIQQVVFAFLMIPLQGMAYIFRQGLGILSVPGINPIVALAQMGTTYINFSSNLWLILLNLSVVSAVLPIFGPFIFALIALAMPLIIAWVGVMVAVGFTTAYYIPLLPYFMFTFGTIAWLIAVIEAMVAGPIVALGVTHPEGHEAFGKGEQAIMILLNVFLRPSMMIIGYIMGIALSYVGVWILNAGFEHAVGFIQPIGTGGGVAQSDFQGASPLPSNIVSQGFEGQKPLPSGDTYTGGYTEWAGVYAFFFSILAYTTGYLIIVQKSFSLITNLPDRILRWIGGTPESYGSEASQWGEEAKQKVDSAGTATQGAQGQIDKQLTGIGQKGIAGAKSLGGKALGGGGSVSAGPTGSDAGDATKGKG